MFIIVNKDKILSYLISISTVTLLFVMSFAITNKNDEILKTSANSALLNSTETINTVKTSTNEVDTSKDEVDLSSKIENPDKLKNEEHIESSIALNESLANNE